MGKKASLKCTIKKNLLLAGSILLGMGLLGGPTQGAGEPAANNPAKAAKDNSAKQKDKKVAKDLKNRKGDETVEVILQFVDHASEKRTKKAEKAIRKAGGRHLRTLGVIGAEVHSVSASAIEELAEDPNVRYISPVRGVKARLDYATPAVFADITASYGWSGDGIGVAVIDSGIHKHPDLKHRTAYSEVFVPGMKKSDDQFGHGTHVAGIVAGDGSSLKGSPVVVQGVAPGAHLIDLQVLDANGAGTESQLIAAIERAIELKDKYNIRVMNLSLGRPVFESYAQDPLCQAVEEAWNAGIVVVAAAGNEGRDNTFENDGYGTVGSPGNDPYVITVGAMKTASTDVRADDAIASYSSKGPTLLDHVVKPDIVAPGNRMISLAAHKSNLQELYPQNAVLLSYFWDKKNSKESPLHIRLSGTSMATPMVSGAVALLLEKEPGLTPDQVKARLMKTASKSFPSVTVTTDPVTGQSFTSQYDIFTIGAGYLDVHAALTSNDVASAEYVARSPIAYLNEATGEILVGSEYNDVCGDSAVWGRSLVCEDSELWGRSAVWGRSAIWVHDAVWGDSVFLDGTSALWGHSAIWGRMEIEGFTSLWSSSALWGRTDTTVEENSAIWGRDTGSASSLGSSATEGDLSVMVNGE